MPNDDGPPGPLTDIADLGRLITDTAPLVETLAAIYHRPAMRRLIHSVPAGPATDMDRLRWQIRKAELLATLADEAAEGTLGVHPDRIRAAAEAAWQEVTRLETLVAVHHGAAEHAQRLVRDQLGLSVAL